MENEIKNVNPNKGRGCFIATIIMLIIAIFALLTAAYFGRKQIANYVLNSTEQETVVTNEIENVQEKPLTIQDILEFRTMLKEERRVDSVYMSIPDYELAAILLNIGVDSSKSAIVHEHETNTKLYESVKLGAEIQKNIIQRNDTLVPKDSL